MSLGKEVQNAFSLQAYYNSKEKKFMSNLNIHQCRIISINKLGHSHN